MGKDAFPTNSDDNLRAETKKSILEKNLVYEIIDCCNRNLEIDFKKIHVSEPEIKSPVKGASLFGVKFGKKKARMDKGE